MFREFQCAPQNDDHRVVENGKDHHLQPDVIKLFRRVDEPLSPAEGGNDDAGKRDECVS